MESFAPDVVAINEPKHVDCGARDYVVKRGDLSVGYIEAKDVGKSLDEAERSEQLDRYLRSLENLVLTNYMEFRWYHRGELRESARLARLTRDGKIVSEKKGEAEVAQLFENFLDQTPTPITSSKELSERLARLAHLIRDAVVRAFELEGADSASASAPAPVSPHLRNLRRAFAEVLIPDLDLPQKTAEFAGMYSQTIVYGLFAARCNHQGPEPFRRLGAAREIPRTNPFLRQLFETITGTALDDEPYVGYVDDVVTILDHTDLDSVLADFGEDEAGGPGRPLLRDVPRRLRPPASGEAGRLLHPRACRLLHRPVGRLDPQDLLRPGRWADRLLHRRLRRGGAGPGPLREARPVKGSREEDEDEPQGPDPGPGLRDRDLPLHPHRPHPAGLHGTRFSGSKDRWSQRDDQADGGG